MMELGVLLKAMNDHQQLQVVCTQALDRILAAPLWSRDFPQGRRIPWRSARTAADTFLAEEFNSPGIYLFGVFDNLRYVGKTKNPLRKRVFTRYIGGYRSQLCLAERYVKPFRDKGIAGFPDGDQRWIQENPDRWCRVMAAIDSARHGVESIWVSVLPWPGTAAFDDRTLKQVEHLLIAAGNTLNAGKGYEPLVNVNDR